MSTFTVDTVTVGTAPVALVAAGDGYAWRRARLRWFTAGGAPNTLYVAPSASEGTAGYPVGYGLATNNHHVEHVFDLGDAPLYARTDEGTAVVRLLVTGENPE